MVEQEKEEREGEVKSLRREANMGDEVRERIFRGEGVM